MTLPAWHEEPISKKHNRKDFDCGDAAMNDFLQRYARQSHDLGGAKTILAIDDADDSLILGFYSLAPGAVAYAETPETMRRGLAPHDVPGFRLVRIGVLSTSNRKPPLRIDSSLSFGQACGSPRLSVLVRPEDSLQHPQLRLQIHAIAES